MALHEVGHVLGGKVVGFRFHLLIVGPLKISRSRDGLGLGLNRSLALYGGLAASVPPDARDLRRRMAVMVAGGPVTSLVAGTVVLTLWLALDPGAVHPGTHTVLDLYLRNELVVFGGSSVVVGALTLVPARTAGFLTDGARLWLLREPGPEADRETAIWQVMSRSMAGVRPREAPFDRRDGRCPPMQLRMAHIRCRYIYVSRIWGDPVERGAIRCPDRAARR